MHSIQKYSEKFIKNARSNKLEIIKEFTTRFYIALNLKDSKVTIY
jgi:hypothetical protein